MTERPFNSDANMFAHIGWALSGDPTKNMWWGLLAAYAVAAALIYLIHVF